MPRRVPSFRPVPKAAVRRAYENTRGRQEDKNFYSSTRWIRLRLAFLAENPLCHDCKVEGRIVPAVDVHHIKERKDFPELAYEWSNLQALCKRCHNGKRKGSAKA